MANLSGKSIIGSASATASADAFRAVNPATGEVLDPPFYSATPEELEHAVQLASEAFVTYSRVSGRQRAEFLRAIAANIESIAADIIPRAMQETALPQARLQSETARTCGQLRLFAQVAEEGSWVNARIDPALPDRKPLPRPDIRSMLRPLGPVVVFGASNFPLAFSVAGGDSASAFAAGNTVIVKAHPAHPGTSEMVGAAIQRAVQQCGLPQGVFSLLFDSGTRVAAELVRHPQIKAAGFTGSRAGGRALMDIAASRPDPIPFYAEMSSANPVFILPGALRERANAIAEGLYTSFTMGAGQFCTKPGIVMLPAADHASAFRSRLIELVGGPASFHLLTRTIHSSYTSGIARRSADSAVTVLAQGPSPQSCGFSSNSALFETDADSFLDSDLADEIFGPTTLLVRDSSREHMMNIARSLDGHLTATIHGTENDLRDFAGMIAILENKVGRIIFNGFPTGVEVSHAMVHGGPYPSTSDGRSTSVGSQAIFRFARPVCYQGFPDSTLPDELKASNPLNIWRMLDGEMTRDPLPTPQQK